MTEQETTDFKDIAEQVYTHYFVTMTVQELEKAYLDHVEKTKIPTNRWGKVLYDAPSVCAICGVHTEYSHGFAPPVEVLHFGHPLPLNSTYCPEHYQLVQERDDLKEAIDLRKHGILFEKEIKKDLIIQRYREKMGRLYADHNRCMACEHGQGCMGCSSSINGHANIFRREI